MKFPDKLHKKIVDRKENNSYRQLCTGSKGIDFSSNDYLGFSKNKRIAGQVNTSLNQFENLNGSTGSRLISGNHVLHEELESELSSFFKSQSALLFNSGYDANLGLLSCLPQHGDVILFDELCHASIRDGIRLSYAKSYKFKHNDLTDLKKKFNTTRNQKGNTYVIVESIYSMDGDQAPLMEFVKFCKNNLIYMMVDEAHATGVYGNSGNGLIGELGLEDHVFARIHTFGKAMGCHGAVIVGSSELKHFLINYARSFIYTTAIPLHNVLTIKYAIKELLVTNEGLKLLNNITYFRNEIKIKGLQNLFVQSESAIQSCIIPHNFKVKDLAQKLRNQNYDIKAILSPTVPKGKERLRFCLHSFNTKKDISNVLCLLKEIISKSSFPLESN